MSVFEVSFLNIFEICSHAFHPDCLVFKYVLVSSRHAKLPSGSMKILETRLSDSGLYVCVASNIAGNLTQSIELSILGKFRRLKIYDDCKNS